MSTLQVIHFWVAGSCLAVAMLGLALMFVGLALPVRSRVGDRLFAMGILGAVGAVVLYLLYAAASVVTIVLVRS